MYETINDFFVLKSVPLNLRMWGQVDLSGQLPIDFHLKPHRSILVMKWITKLHFF